jgi:hypothetical protein
LFIIYKEKKVVKLRRFVELLIGLLDLVVIFVEVLAIIVQLVTSQNVSWTQ